MKNVQQIADTAVDEILSTRPQGKRAAAYNDTFLNRSPRTLSAIRRRFQTAAKKLGFAEPAVNQM